MVGNIAQVFEKNRDNVKRKKLVIIMITISYRRLSCFVSLSMCVYYVDGKTIICKVFVILFEWDIINMYHNRNKDGGA